MTTKRAAAGLASLGRGNDSMLIHMSPTEVAGLQQLALAHGGSLTVNPHTGLPEAGFLENILPTVLGVGLGMMGVPTWAAGLGTGAFETMRSGNLGKGLMAGLGAFGGAGLGNAATQSGLFGLGEAATSPSLALQPPSAPQMTMAPAVEAAGNMTPVPGNAFMQSGIPTAADAPANQLFGGMHQANEAFTGAAERPGFVDALKGQFSKPWEKAAAGIGALGLLGGIDEQKPATMPGAQYSGRLSGAVRRPYDAQRNLFTDYGILRPTYAAEGGEMHSVPQLEDGGFVLTKKAVDGIGRGDNERGQERAAEGLGAIPIRGPGTGTSDSIPTNIDGVRPAAVSNGEAYIPAREVKKRGGAKKFYELMRKAERAAGSRRS